MKIPGCRPLMATGVVVALSGIALFVLGVVLGVTSVALGSEGAAWGAVASLGYGFQGAVLGGALILLGLAVGWTVERRRRCQTMAR